MSARAPRGNLTRLAGRSDGGSDVDHTVRRSLHQIVRDVLAGQPHGWLLDIPAGDGWLGEAATTLGHHVVEIDLFARRGLQGVVADANMPLPLRDASFEMVVSVEGLEHLENQAAFLRECARVLRPGGGLILTTPNILHLGARLSVFFTGQRLLKQGFVNEVTTLRGGEGNRLHHGHAFLIDAFRLRYLLRVAGLDFERLHVTRLSSSSLWLAPLVPLVWLATRFSLWSGRRRHRRRGRPLPGDEVERELRSIALSPATLFSSGLVVVARKPREQRS